MLPATTLVRQSRLKLALILLGSLALTACAGWMIVSPHPARALSQTATEVVGYLGVVLFGVSSLALLLMTLKPRTLLTLDAQGAFDHSRKGFGLIPWSDVLGIGESNVVGTRFLILRVRDPQRYVETAGRHRRAALNTNIKMLGSPITFPTQALDLSHARLVERCRAYLRQAQEEHQTNQSQQEQTP